MQKRFTEEQIIGILREAEVDGAVIRGAAASTTSRSNVFPPAEQVRGHDGFRRAQAEGSGVGECPAEEDRDRTDVGH